MKPKTRFLKMYYKLPEKARHLTWQAFGRHPATLNVIASEVRNDTQLGKDVLFELGYTDKQEKTQMRK